MVDDRLENWSDVSQRLQCSGILIGNGASCAVWKDFGYASLFQIAQESGQTNKLGPQELAVFTAFDTKNFEQVLGALNSARIVNNALGLPATEIPPRYTAIQNALVEAVKCKHVPWQQVPSSTLSCIQSALLDYKFVSVRNYSPLDYRRRRRG